MKSPRQPPAPNFDRVAHLYRWAEYLTLGPLLQRIRTHFLPRLTHARHAVVFGDGDGRFLARLLAQNEDLRATAVDTSERMLALLKARCYKQSLTTERRLRILQQSALEHTCSRDTDLIVTHFFLDCLTQPELTLFAARVAQQVDPGTLWLVSDFRVPDNALRPFARLYIRALYFAFRILTNIRVNRLPEPPAALIDAGFNRVAEHSALGGVLYTELWQRIPLVIQSKSCMSLNDPNPHGVEDAQPNPEPAVPSLPGPDPGVFHHQSGDLPADPASPPAPRDQA